MTSGPVFKKISSWTIILLMKLKLQMKGCFAFIMTTVSGINGYICWHDIQSISWFCWHLVILVSKSSNRSLNVIIDHYWTKSESLKILIIEFLYINISCGRCANHQWFFLGIFRKPVFYSPYCTDMRPKLID